METLTMEHDESITNSEILEDVEKPSITSRFGIICQQTSRSLELVVPVNVFEKIHVGDQLMKMLQDNFCLGANVVKDSYVIEFPTNMAVEKIQAIVNEIEAVHENELNKETVKLKE